MFGDSIPLIIGLLSALIGIRGDTWHDRAKGWRRLTLTGWIVAVLAVGSFAAALLNAYSSHKEVAQKLRKETLLTAQAGQDVLDALNRFLVPLEQILETTESPPTDQTKLEEYVISRHMKDGSDYLDAFMSDAFIERLRMMPAKTCPFPEEKDPDCRLDRIVSGYSRTFESQMRDLLPRYQSVLDADLAALMEEARNHKMLSIFRATASNVERNRELGKDVDQITLGWLLFGPHEPNELYRPYLRILKDLKTAASKIVRETRPAKETLFTEKGPRNSP